MTQLQDTLDDLLELQTVDSQIARLKRTQAGLDNGTQAGQDATTRRDRFNRESQELHRLSGELKDSELKLQSIESKLKTNQQRLYQGTVSNPKELVNLEREIGSLQHQRSDLDERILQLMEQVETQRRTFDSAQEQARLAETHHTTTVGNWRAKYEAATQEIAGLEQRRIAINQAIGDKALLKRYDELRSRLGGVGIAKINGSNCGVCGMTLPSSAVRAVREGIEPTTCENCGRLLTLG